MRYNARMLICLGGIFGSGRKVLAKKLSERLQYHYFDISDKKFRRLIRDDKGVVHERVVQPRTSVERKQLYEKALREMPLLSKMYPDMVMDDGFYLREPRDYFFAEVKKYFDPVIFIWVDTTDDLAFARFESYAIEKKTPERAAISMQHRKKMMQTLESFTTVPATFHYDSTLESAVAKLADMLPGVQPL